MSAQLFVLKTFFSYTNADLSYVYMYTQHIVIFFVYTRVPNTLTQSYITDARSNTLNIEFMHWNVESVLDFYERIESMATATEISSNMLERKKNHHIYWNIS